MNPTPQELAALNEALTKLHAGALRCPVCLNWLNPSTMGAMSVFNPGPPDAALIGFCLCKTCAAQVERASDAEAMAIMAQAGAYLVGEVIGE